MLTRPSILLVEDRSDDAELAMLSLQRAGFGNDIVWVRDGRAALDYLFHEGAYLGQDLALPELVLLDLHMPGMSGLTALEHIRRDQRTEFIPVFMLTVSDDQNDSVTSMQYGANDYISKPLDASQLRVLAVRANLRWYIAGEKKP